MNIFRSFKNDRVTLVKKDGKRFEDLPASVQSGLILTDNPEIPIEDGDQFERQLPSGIVDVFTVVDSGFHQRFKSIPAHYQSKVRKNTAAPPPSPRPAAEPQVVYNLIGPNARVNIQSSDSVHKCGQCRICRSVRQLARSDPKILTGFHHRAAAHPNVSAMQSAVGTKTFGERYKEFIAVAADHMTLVAPFLPALTQLLL